MIDTQNQFELLQKINLYSTLKSNVSKIIVHIMYLASYLLSSSLILTNTNDSVNIHFIEVGGINNLQEDNEHLFNLPHQCHHLQ